MHGPGIVIDCDATRCGGRDGMEIVYCGKVTSTGRTNGEIIRSKT